VNTFVDSMPPAVSRQRDLLRRLLHVLEPDPVWRWFELSCSLGRGAGDELSDVDCGAGAAPLETGLSTVEDLVGGLGDVVDIMHQPFGEQARHTFVQYADGMQLSLVVFAASARPGLPPGSVALFDKDGQLARPWQPSVFQASADQVREWTFLGWIALADLAKYVRRGSMWEAHARLEEARTQLLRVWAAGQGVEFPSYGLTSILDSSLDLPSGVDQTVAGLDPAGLLAAGRACATLLRQHAVALPMGAYVEELLAR
jgi:hypothetical protein